MAHQRDPPLTCLLWPALRSGDSSSSFVVPTVNSVQALDLSAGAHCLMNRPWFWFPRQYKVLLYPHSIQFPLILVKFVGSYPSRFCSN